MAPNVKNVVEEPEESWPDHPGASNRFIDLDISLDGKDYGRRSTSGSHRPKSNEIRNGNAWREVNALQSNLHIEVGDRSFHLHEFPLISKSGKLNRLVFELRDPGKDRISLNDVPGGAAAFESMVRCLYGRSSIPLTSANVAPLRCAAEFLEMNDSLGAGSLVAETEHYLNLVVVGSWKESIAVLRSCSNLKPWAEELEIVRRCSESVAWKACTDPHGLRWSYTKSSNARNRWWFDDVCSLHIDTFTKVINAVIAKGMEYTTVAAVVTQYAEKWLNLANYDSKSGAQNPPLVGFSHGCAAQIRNRGILQRIVSLLPSQPNSLSCKVLLKLLRAACAVNAGALCKTDLARRIGAQLEKVAVGELLIPAYGASSEAMYDIDVVVKIVEYYLQEQSSIGRRQPLSSRSTTSVLTVTTSSSSDRTVSGSNASATSVTGTTDSRSTTITQSTMSGSGTSSTRTTSSMSDSSGSDESTTTGTTSSSEPGSVKLEYSRFSTDQEPTRRPQLPPISSNLKVAHLLENILEEVAKDSSIPVQKFVALADLFVDFPRESDDCVYLAIDTFLRSHASLNDEERRMLCKMMDIQALSLNACMHAAANERLPLRVVVQVLFAEQVKLRNAIMETAVSTTASFSSSISRDTYSDSCSSTSTATGTSTSSRSVHSVAPSAAPSFASSPMPGGLNVKDTLRSALSEIELLRTAVLEIETVKERLNFMDVLQQEMENINRKFMDLAQDFTHQGEEPTKGFKQKGGWTSGWKKMAKPFHGKDHLDSLKGFNNSLVSEKHLKAAGDTIPLYQQMTILHPTDVPFLQDSKRPVQAAEAKFAALAAPKAVVAAASRIPEANVETPVKVVVMPKVETAPKPDLAIVPPTQPKTWPENAQLKVNGVTEPLPRKANGAPERHHSNAEDNSYQLPLPTVSEERPGRHRVSKDEPPRQSTSEKNHTLRNHHHHKHGGAHQLRSQRTPSPHGDSHHGRHSDSVSVSSHYSYSSDRSNSRHRLRNTSSSYGSENRSHRSSSHDHGHAHKSSHHRHGSRSRSPDSHRHRRSHHNPDDHHRHHSKDPPRPSSATKHGLDHHSDHHHHSRDPPRASSATKRSSDHHSNHHHQSRDPPRASSATKHGSDCHSDHRHHHSRDPPRASSATKHGSDHHSDHHHHSRDPPRASSATKHGSDHHSDHHHHHSRDPPRASSATKHGSDHHSDHHHHSRDPPRAISSATKHGSDHIHSDHHHQHSRDDPPRASSAGTDKNGSDHHSGHREHHSKPHYRSRYKHDHSKDYYSASTYSSDSGPGRAARPRRHSGV